MTKKQFKNAVKNCKTKNNLISLCFQFLRCQTGNDLCFDSLSTLEDHFYKISCDDE